MAPPAPALPAQWLHCVPCRSTAISPGGRGGAPSYRRWLLRLVLPPVAEKLTTSSRRTYRYIQHIDHRKSVQTWLTSTLFRAIKSSRGGLANTPLRKKGWGTLQKQSQKNTKKALTVSRVEDGWIRCPRCKRGVAKAYYGARCYGIELKCRCGALVRIEIGL